jgi:AcrR family transcriptional regulator
MGSAMGTARLCRPVPLSGRERPAVPIPFAEYRLPPGRHGLPPEFVAENQRWRLLGACAEALSELGYAKLSTREISTRAGVSVNAFYEHFDDLSACVATAHQTAVDCLWEAIGGACDSRLDSPRVVVEAAIEAALAFAAFEPQLARLLDLEAVAAVETVASQQELLIGRLAGLLREHAAPSTGAAELSPVLGRQLIGASISLVSGLVGAGDRFPDVAPQLSQLLLAFIFSEEA